MIDLAAIRARAGDWPDPSLHERDRRDLLGLVDRLTAALRGAEWHRQTAADEPECPSCLNFQSEGHATLCYLAALLAEIEGRTE